MLPPLRTCTLLAALSALPAQSPTTPYDADPAHPANRIFHAIHYAELVPVFIGAALPGEHGDEPDFYVPKWYFQQRGGNEADQALFGGDGRQIPRERFNPSEANALADALRALDDGVVDELRAQPRLAVYLQHDLLRIARRLCDTKANPELLPALLAAAERVALPAATLVGGELTTFRLEQIGPHLHGIEVSELVEIDRRSTRLFDAGFTQLWSKVYLAVPADAAPSTDGLLAAALDAAGATPPNVPVGTTAVLVQGIVALDDAGEARATDLVIDVRTQRLSNLDDLGRDNATTTRDGVDLQQWFLPRLTVATAPGPLGLADFRSVPMATPELFRDYGTLKYTTYAAQCSLCHRRTGTPDGALAGFLALRANAKPQRTDPGTRLRRAEQELAAFIAELRSR
ncbi:MAG: hypothetical protein KDE27_20690 [Planctomycetes bacterium]|nr:hypothetical protein [Planctomycetota bacterium]